jgi:hypothetical protein
MRQDRPLSANVEPGKAHVRVTFREFARYERLRGTAIANDPLSWAGVFSGRKVE